MKSSISRAITPVIVTYNSSKHILTLLKSIDNKISSPLISKIVVIENNSPDSSETKRIVTNFRSKNNIKLKFILSDKNNGFAKSCNYGASLVNSKYVLFLNPDTKLRKNSLKILLNEALISSADLIGGETRKYNGEIHNTVVRFPTILIGLLEFSNIGKLLGTKFGNDQFYYKDINIYQSSKDMEVEALGGAYLMSNIKSFRKINGFDEDYFMYLEDVDLSLRAHNYGFKVVFCPHSVIEHIGGASSTNKHHIRHQAWYDSRRIYFKKHFGIVTNIFIQSLFIVEEFLLKMREKYL